MGLDGKKIVLGVCGGIAAYKIASLASMLTKAGGDVTVIMTKSATEFVTPLTFETLTGNRCITDTFDRNFEWDVKHVSLAKSADIILIAPATANVIAKLANGLADDMLTTTVLAARCKKLVAPSMNTAMYENIATAENIQKLVRYGFEIIEPASGLLACRDVGKGRLPEVEVLFDAVECALCRKDLSGKKVLVTAGPTCEEIDPVRFITNHSTGKMGYAIAKAAAYRGAEVLLISGKTNLKTPYGVKRIEVFTAKDMFEAVKENFKDYDFIIKAAAVGDYRPEGKSGSKIKKGGGLELKLVMNEDILKYIGEHREKWQKICGFSMETDNLEENSAKKLKNKKCHMIVANSLNSDGAGFAADTNKVILITEKGTEDVPLMKKSELADIILDRLSAM